ncbi:MAG: response regulator transcription factor [Chloroflexi bacterium]|nr:response regulator transcription factor [Chloroflexota bacterium]
MRTILILGDETLEPYARALEGTGYDVSRQGPGASEPAQGSFDAAVLDLASLGEDAAAKRLLDGAHAADSPAVIAIIQPGQVAAFDPARGPDDFILAGADPAELCARVRLALWRRSRVDDKNILKCGELVMDLANYTVHVAGRPVELTFKEYELLRFLATNRDRVINRETLLNKVWGYDFFGGARTVDVHIRRLRSKIEDRHNTFIDTVRNVGYRFRASP